MLAKGEMYMENSWLSIVTPTFNRAYLLKRCFASLTAQTVDTFEWIVVDDGSTDDTREVVEGFISSAPDLRIRYVYKENGGKHTAMNASHPFLRGKYVMILDSDDYLTPDAVEQVLKAWGEYQDDPSIGTLIFLRGDKEGNRFAYRTEENRPNDYRKLKKVNVISSDCCEVFRTEQFLQFPYSAFEGERFLSESELWNRLAEAGYRCVYVNRIVYICEYQRDGLTQAGRRMRIKNPLGGMCTSEHFLNRIFSTRMRLKKALLYVCYGFFAGLSPWRIITQSRDYRGIKTACLVPGYVMYRWWKRSYTE